ncbi:MAG: dienelactone hydrolase family protein [Usitatibacter sp.]
MRIFAAAALATALHASAASPVDAEKITFPSVICKGEPVTCDRLTGLGYLFAQPGQKAVVLISHGSQGIDARMYDYVDALQKEGIAAFVLDHWGPRGIGVTHHDYHAASLRGGDQFNMAIDSLLAGELLRARGFQRVGSIGESQGAAAAILLQKKSAHAEIERTVSRLYARDFKVRPIDAVVAMYGYCGLRNAFRDSYVGTPFLFITGEKDDDTPSRYCERYVPWMNERGGNASIVVLEGEGHSFDAPYRRMRSPNEPHAAKCDVLVDQRGVTNLITGETLPGQNTQPMFEKCMARDGYHSGWWKDRFIAVPHWIGFFRKNL